MCPPPSHPTRRATRPGDALHEGGMIQQSAAEFLVPWGAAAFGVRRELNHMGKSPRANVRLRVECEPLISAERAHGQFTTARELPPPQNTQLLAFGAGGDRHGHDRAFFAFDRESAVDIAIEHADLHSGLGMAQIKRVMDVLSAARGIAPLLYQFVQIFLI